MREGKPRCLLAGLVDIDVSTLILLHVALSSVNPSRTALSAGTPLSYYPPSSKLLLFSYISPAEHQTEDWPNHKKTCFKPNW